MSQDNLHSFETPLLSICCLTYNHQHYIRAAIEGFISQKTNFSYEIIIHDDASTDQTVDIIKEYQKAYPRLIFPIFQSENQYSRGIKPLPNFLWPQVRGKYIALCEGDDYWTDPNKLQIQVEFLETHPEYSISYHRVKELYESTGELALEKLNLSGVEKDYTIEDLAKRNLIHTPSVVIRKNFEQFPDWFMQCPIGDYPLNMLVARHGLIRYFPLPMAVYRIHPSSTWSSLDFIPQIKKWLRVLTDLIKEFNDESRIKRILFEQLLLRYRIFYEACFKENAIDLLKEETIRLLQFSDEFIDFWFDELYLHQIRQLEQYPLGVKKSFKHLIKSIKTSFKN